MKKGIRILVGLVASVVITSSLSTGVSATTVNLTNTQSITNTTRTVNTLSELQNYLNETYPSLATPIGNLKFKFSIMENDSTMLGYDFKINTDFGEISDSNALTDFQPYYLEYSIKISDDDKEETINLLKNFQKTIAEDVSKRFPTKKIRGGFYSGFYKYHYLKAGYTSIDFLSWVNYDDNDETYKHFDKYNYTEVSDFQWDDDKDDYNFAD